MLKNSFFLAFFVFVNILFSQNEGKVYVTYFIPENKNLDFHKRQHRFILKEKTICVELLSRGDVVPSSEICFDYTLQSDTLFIGKRISKISEAGLQNYVINEFENQKLIRLSDDEFVLNEVQRPYFSEKFIRKLRGNNLIFFINGKMKKVGKQQATNLINRYIRKKATIKLLEGEESYQKYGAIGIGQIFEITDEQ